MSNTSFRVDLAELGALRDALVRAEQTVRNAAGALGAADTAAPGDAPGGVPHGLLRAHQGVAQGSEFGQVDSE